MSRRPLPTGLTPRGIRGVSRFAAGAALADRSAGGIAWKAFQELPLPHDQPPGPQQEEWMRTDIRGFHLEKFRCPNELGRTGTAWSSGS